MRKGDLSQEKVILLIGFYSFSRSMASTRTTNGEMEILMAGALLPWICIQPGLTSILGFPTFSEKDVKLVIQVIPITLRKMPNMYTYNNRGTIIAQAW